MKSTQSAQQKSAHSKRPKKHEPLSPAASRIVQSALSADVSLSDLADMAQTDPAFALRVLSYVNNPVLGLGRRIDSIHQASMLLGLRGLRSLALSLVITHLAPETTGTETLLANCLRRAIAAQQIARRMGYLEPEIAFSLGLFLDSGLLVSAKTDPKAAINIGNSPACYRLIRERAEGLWMHPDFGRHRGEGPFSQRRIRRSDTAPPWFDLSDDVARPYCLGGGTRRSRVRRRLLHSSPRSR